MLDYVKIGQQIRKLRRANNLSQEQLAEMVWISTTHMSHIETGSTKLSLPVLVDIANALNVSTDEILYGAIAWKNNHSENEIRAVLNSCTPQQEAFLVYIIKSAKEALDQCFK